MLKVQLKLKSAEQALANIQEEATAAEAAGFVSEGLKKKLKAAEEEVTTAKENVEWQKEFLKFQGLSEDKFGGLARGAAKMGSAAGASAAKATKAIKSAIDRQLQFVNEGYKKEKALLEQKFKAGLIGEDKYLKDLIRLEEKYVDASLQKGLLSGAELSKWSERINNLKSSLEDVKSVSKGIVPIGEAIFGEGEADVDAEDITGDVGKNLLTGAKNLGSSFSDNFADGLLETARTRLTAAFSDIGTKVSELFKTKILDKITPAQRETGGVIGSALLGIGVSATIAKIGLVASKIGMLGGLALRLSVIGTGIWLIWKNWDTILAGISATIEYLTGVWGDFTEKLGGSEETLKLFSDIFTSVKDTLTEIGTGLKDFVLDALAGESISFADFIDIFDISGIDTGAITKVVEAFMSVLQEQVDKIKLSITLGDRDEEPTRIGGEIEGADPTRFEKIVANFIRIFDNLKQSIADIQASFSEFMAEDRLGGQIAGLVDAIAKSWKGLSIVIGGPLLLYLPKVLVFLGRFVPIIGPIASALGKLIPIVGIATVFIGNFEKIWPPLETALGGAILTITGIVEAIGGLFLLFDDETRAEGVGMFFSGITNIIEGLQDAFLGLGVTIANFFLSAIADISGGVAGILEAFGLDEIAKPFRNVEESLDAVAVSLKAALADALDVLRSLGLQVRIILFLVARNFTTWAKGIWKSVTGWFTKLWDDLVGRSIITDMIDDIVAVFASLGQKVSVEAAVKKIKDSFSAMTTFISSKARLASLVVRSRFAAMSTYMTDKASALKDFATEAGTFVSDLVTTASTLKFDTIDDTVTSIDTLVESITGFNLIDISVGIENITASLTTLATDGLAIIEGFIVDTVASFTGVDISAEIETIFEPINTALTAIADFDISEAISGIFSALSEAENPLDLIPIPDMSVILSPITTAFETMSTDSTGYMTDVSDGLAAIFSGDISEDATAFAISAALPIANMGITINDTVTSIADDVSGIFTDIDLSADATLLAVGAATPIALLEATIGDSATSVAESLLEMFDIDLDVPLSEISTTVTDGIDSMVTSGIDSVSSFATDFVDYILAIPTKIKEKISDFTDVGSLLSSAFGFGDEDITGEVASELKGGEDEIVAPVESTTDKIKNAWDDAYDWVVGNSVVPDLVTGVTEQFTLLSTIVQPTVTSLTLGIQNSFTMMSGTIRRSVMGMNLAIYTDIYNTNLLISNDYMLLTQAVSAHMFNMQTNTSMALNTIRPMWQSSFTAMIDTTRAFGVIGNQVLTAINNAIKRLTISVNRLRLSLVNAKLALDELRETDMVDLTDSFEYMLALVKKTKSEAEKFAKFMEAARDAAMDIGDTLGGNVPGGDGVPAAQHGAWRVPRNQLMFLHEGETILPPEVAANFRRLMVVLQEAGIGGRSFGFQTGTPQAAAGTVPGPHVTTITNNFPNVTSAQEAESIVDILNKQIDDGRKFAAIGGQS
jgi:hypothetical protein